jgi:hypothetical protein
MSAPAFANKRALFRAVMGHGKAGPLLPFINLTAQPAKQLRLGDDEFNDCAAKR